MATSDYFGEHFERRLAALDAALERCRADAKTSRVKPAEEVVDRLEAKYAHGRGAGEPRARGPVRVFPAEAEAGLEEIGDYIAKVSPAGRSSGGLPAHTALRGIRPSPQTLSHLSDHLDGQSRPRACRCDPARRAGL